MRPSRSRWAMIRSSIRRTTWSASCSTSMRGGSGGASRVRCGSGAPGAGPPPRRGRARAPGTAAAGRPSWAAGGRPADVRAGRCGYPDNLDAGSSAAVRSSTRRPRARTRWMVCRTAAVTMSPVTARPAAVRGSPAGTPPAGASPYGAPPLAGDLGAARFRLSNHHRRTGRSRAGATGVARTARHAPRGAHRRGATAAAGCRHSRTGSLAQCQVQVPRAARRRQTRHAALRRCRAAQQHHPGEGSRACGAPAACRQRPRPTEPPRPRARPRRPAGSAGRPAPTAQFAQPLVHVPAPSVICWLIDEISATQRRRSACWRLRMSPSGQWK